MIFDERGAFALRRRSDGTRISRIGVVPPHQPGSARLPGTKYLDLLDLVISVIHLIRVIRVIRVSCYKTPSYRPGKR
jgi:hypothetical protein